jgi:hypothetical protein
MLAQKYAKLNGSIQGLLCDVLIVLSIDCFMLLCSLWAFSYHLNVILVISLSLQTQGKLLPI